MALTLFLWIFYFYFSLLLFSPFQQAKLNFQNFDISFSPTICRPKAVCCIFWLQDQKSVFELIPLFLEFLNASFLTPSNIFFFWTKFWVSSLPTILFPLPLRTLGFSSQNIWIIFNSALSSLFLLWNWVCESFIQVLLRVNLGGTIYFLCNTLTIVSYVSINKIYHSARESDLKKGGHILRIFIFFILPTNLFI